MLEEDQEGEMMGIMVKQERNKLNIENLNRKSIVSQYDVFQVYKEEEDDIDFLSIRKAVVIILSYWRTGG